MENDLTVQKLYDKLGELIDQGYGDFRVNVSFDSGYAGTSIQDKDPKIYKDDDIKYCSVKFEGY